MLRPHTFLRVISCTLLFLNYTSGERWPHLASTGTPDVENVDNQSKLLLEAVGTGILRFLGLDKEPKPTQKASEEEFREMYELYSQTMREMGGNSSLPRRETQKSTMSTVLFPGEPVKVLRWRQHPQSGQRMLWYRATFQKNQNIKTELSLAQARLKISWRSSDEVTDARREVKVKVNRKKVVISGGWTNTDSSLKFIDSKFREVTSDIGPAVEMWVRTDGQPLVVDVGMMGISESPTIALELSFKQLRPAERTRLRRSDKEDDCDERGWCCRKSIVVSFKDLGWTDWVFAPEEYTMHFCEGTCPHNYKPASMHTQVKSRLHHITKGGTPRPCCVPAAYEPMVIMHYDSRGKLKLTPFNDFIVSKCHCA